MRVAAVRNRLVHDYVGVAAEDVHEAARLLLAALPGFVSGYQDWVRAEFHPASNRQPDGRGPPETQVYLGDDELELLDRVARATGASRSELIRRAVRSTFGEQTRGERLHALDASAGSWSGRRLTGAEYVDTLRGDINKRLRRLGVE